MNLETRYLGLPLKNPLIHSSSPLSKKVSNIQKMEEAGIGAVVLHSLFEEQIDAESRMLEAVMEEGTGSFAEAYDYMPQYAPGQVGPQVYLEHLNAVKEAVDIPVIASLNGTSAGGWTRYAKRMEDAGADAIELNLYSVPADPDLNCGQIEEIYLQVIREVCRSVSIPVAVKLSPFFTAPANFCLQASGAGAKGVVLFNRFYQPDIDLESLEVINNLNLSRSEELRLPLRWTAILAKRCPADIAITSGVHGGTDVVKCLLCGASAAMMTSEILLNGVDAIGTTLEGLRTWMAENEYESVTQMKGALCAQHVGDAEAFERGNYIQILGSYTT